MNRRLIALLLCVCMSAVLLAGCGKEAEETEPSTVPTEAPTVPTTEPVTEPVTEPPTEPTEPVVVLTDPLTGEAVDEDMSNWRPYAVVINNISVAQPQCGVGEASIIYELLVEGGITRMLAVYSDISQAGSLGSIRSLRPCSLSVTRAYDALLVHAGGSTMAYNDVQSSGIERLDGVNGGQTANYFYRDPSRQTYGIEHSMFIKAEDVLECVEEMDYRTTLREDYAGFGLQFAEDGTPEGGADASFIDINFRDGKHTKLTLEDSGLYTMDQYGDDYIDGNTGEEVAFRNVLILYAETWNGVDPGESYGRVYMTLTGEGTGHFACGGQVIDIYWTRDGEDEPFRYYLDETHTQPLTLGVGATYVAVVPTSSDAPVFDTAS